MDSRGAIINLSDAEVKALRETLEAGGDPDLVEIPAAMLDEVAQMNRHDRRAWRVKERKRRKARQPDDEETAGEGSEAPPATNEEE